MENFSSFTIHKPSINLSLIGTAVLTFIGYKQTDKRSILINEKIRFIVKIIKFLFNLETYWYLRRKIWSEPAIGIVIVDVKGFVETYLVDLMCTINTFANREGIFFTENLQRFSTVTVTMIFQRPRKYASLGKV